MEEANTDARFCALFLKYLPIVAVIFLQFFVLAITRAVLPAVLHQHYGRDSYTYNGWAEGAKGFLSFLSAPAFGAVSDHMGRRLPLFISVAGTTAPFVALALTNEPSFYLVTLGLSGLTAGTFPVILAMVADVTEDKDSSQKTTAFGFVQASLGMSFAIGPMLGSIISNSFGQRCLFAVAAGLSFIALAYVAFIVPETMQKAKDEQHEGLMSRVNPFGALSVLLISPAMKILTAITALHALAIWCKISTLLLYLRAHFGATQSDLGLFMTSMGTCFMISEAVLLPTIVPRFGMRPLLCVGFAAFFWQLIQLGFASSMKVVFAVVPWALLIGFLNPLLAGLVSLEAGKDVQGKAQGAMSGVRSLMEGVAPLTFGPLMNAFEGTAFPGACYLIAAALVALAFAISYADMRMNQKPQYEIVPETETLQTSQVQFEGKADDCDGSNSTSVVDDSEKDCSSTEVDVLLKK